MTYLVTNSNFECFPREILSFNMGGGHSIGGEHIALIAVGFSKSEIKGRLVPKA